jgi:hypothetical protein
MPSFWLRWGLTNFFPELALSHHPLDCLPKQSWSFQSGFSHLGNLGIQELTVFRCVPETSPDHSPASLFLAWVWLIARLTLLQVLPTRLPACITSSTGEKGLPLDQPPNSSRCESCSLGGGKRREIKFSEPQCSRSGAREESHGKQPHPRKSERIE